MLRGLIFKADRIQFKAKISLNGYSFSSPEYPVFVGGSCALRAYFTPDYIAVAQGFLLQTQTGEWVQTGATQPDPNPYTTYTLAFGSITGSSGDSVFRSESETIFEVDDYEVYADNTGTWLIEYSGARWYGNGTLLGSWGGGILHAAMPVTPSSIPLLGSALEMQGGGGGGFGTPTGHIIGSTSYVDSSGTATGGVRYLIDGTWQEFPVTLPPIVTITNEDGLTVDGICSASTTFNMSIYGQSSTYVEEVYVGVSPFNSSYNFYKENSDVHTIAAKMRVVPDLPKTVTRLNDDYEALVYRGGMPKTTSRGSFTGTDTRPNLPGGTTDPRSGRTFYNQYQETELYPNQSDILARVTNAASPIEDTLGYPTYSMVDASHGHNKRRGIPISYPNTSTVVPTWYEDPFRTMYTDYGYTRSVSAGFQFPYDVTDAMGKILPYLTHADPYEGKKAVYLNTWANPHWSYVLWFPPDSSAASSRWKIDGTPASIQDYWSLVRQQFIENPYLPSGDRTKHRTNVVTEPLACGGFLGLFSGVVFGEWTSYWGISRFIAQKVTPAEWLKTDERSASRFTFTNATGIVDASGITVTPSGTNVSVTFDYDSFFVYPHMGAHVRDDIELTWQTANIDEVTVYAMGNEGSEQRLTANVQGIKERVVGSSKNYAATYATDWGADYTDDQGLDVDAKGKSLDYVNDAARTFSFALLPAKGIRKLRFDIKVTNPASTVKLLHPRFKRTDDNTAKLVRESPAFTSSLSPKGSWYRMGTWTVYDELLDTLLTSPVPRQGSQAPRAIDWLATRRLLWEGRDALDGVQAEAETLFVKDKEFVVAKDLARRPEDKQQTTHWFPYKRTGNNPLVGVIVSSYREVAPLAFFPTKARDLDLQPTTGFSQKTYSLCFNKQWLLTPGTPTSPLPELKPNTAGASIITPSSPVDGWVGGYHTATLSTDGSEAGWLIDRGGKHYGKAIRPWRGYLGVFLRQAETKTLSYDTSEAMRHYLAYVNTEGRVWVKRADNIIPFDWEESDTGIDATAVCVRVDRRSKNQKLHLLFAQDNNIKWATSLDEGVTWTMPTTIAPGTFPTLLISRAGMKYIYWVDGTAVKGKILSATDEVIQNTFTAINTVDADSGIAVDESFTAKGVYRVTLAYIEGATAKTQTSQDGKTFS